MKDIPVTVRRALKLFCYVACKVNSMWGYTFCLFHYEPSIWNNYTNEHNKAIGDANNLALLVQSYLQQRKAEDKLRKTQIRGSFNDFVLFNF